MTPVDFQASYKACVKLAASERGNALTMRVLLVERAVPQNMLGCYLTHSLQDEAPSYVGHLFKLDAGIQLAGPGWLLNMSTASDKCQDSLVNRNPDGIFSSTAAILVLFIFSLFWTLYKEEKNP